MTLPPNHPETANDRSTRQAAERAALYQLLPPSQQRQMDNGRRRALALFFVIGILGWSGILWVPILSGIIYRAFH